MELRLNLSGVEVQLNINDWSMQDIDIAWGNWCNVGLLFSSNYFNYDASGEILTNSEIRNIWTVLKRLFNGELSQEEHLMFVEPYLEFYFRPARRIKNIPGKLTIIPNGFTDKDMEGTMRINLHASSYAVGRNFISMGLMRQDMYAIYIYISYITGQIDMNSNEVIKLVDQGFLLP